MLSAAPVPRPPQPIRPTLIVSLPLAWALGRKARPATVAVDALRKSRRLGELVDSVMGSFSGVKKRAHPICTMPSEGPRGRRTKRRQTYVDCWEVTRQTMKAVITRHLRPYRAGSNQRVVLPLTT